MIFLAKFYIYKVGIHLLSLNGYDFMPFLLRQQFIKFSCGFLFISWSFLNIYVYLFYEVIIKKATQDHMYRLVLRKGGSYYILI